MDLPTTTKEEARASLQDFKSLQGAIWSASVFSFVTTRSSQVGCSPELYGLSVLDSADSNAVSRSADNTLTVMDAAMDDETRDKLLVGFEDFANDVERSKNDGYKPYFAQADVPPQEPLYIADNCIELVKTEKGVLLYNWIMDERYFFPGAGWAVLIVRARSLQPFTREDLFQLFSSRNAGELAFRTLAEQHVFMTRANYRLFHEPLTGR